MFLSDAIDEMLVRTREIREFALALAQSNDLTHEQWADMQQLQDGTNELLSVLWEVHVLPEYQDLEIFSLQCRTALNTILGFTQVFLEGLYGELSGYYRGVFMQIGERTEMILRLLQQLCAELYTADSDVA
jgi:hypothetical protein